MKKVSQKQEENIKWNDVPMKLPPKSTSSTIAKNKSGVQQNRLKITFQTPQSTEDKPQDIPTEQVDEISVKLLDPNQKVIRVSPTQLHSKLTNLIDQTNKEEMENKLN